MIIAHVVEPFATGINTFIHELVIGMPEHEHIIIHGERKDTREIEGIKEEYNGKAQFIRWKSAQRDIDIKLDLKAFFELRKTLKALEFDVLHLHSSKAGVLGRLLAYLEGYKNVIYTPNGASFLRKDITKKKIRQYEKIEKFCNRFDARVVSSSVSEQKAFSDFGVKTKIIQNGVKVKKGGFNNKTSSTFNIVTCGKITIQKNPEYLNAIAAFFKDNPEITFTWIGDGELKDVLTQVEVTGWCSREEVFHQLSKADLYISTSLWEGLPLAGIEAMGLGLPLLMNDCVGNNDLVNNGINGFIFDSKIKAIEDIEYLKENRNVMKSLSENSIKMYDRHYNNFRCANDYNELYKAICRKTSIANANI